jgi:hypoxanthine phosphoribosyltransferase
MVLMSQPHRYLAPSWDAIYEMLVDIALSIKYSGFKPHYIVGVSRGGWTPGRVLSDLLENSRTANIKIEFYVGIGKTVRKPVVTQPLTENIANKNVLVVDDVSDTGESLKVAVDHMVEKGAAIVKTATVYYKPHSIFKPDFFADLTSDWIIFPWERLEATRLLMQDAQSQGADLDSVRETLRQCSISDGIIDALFRLASSGT